jgi:hypothetical protein
VRQGGQRTETAGQAVAVVHIGVVARRQGQLILSRFGIPGGQCIHRQVVVRFGPLVVVTERPGVAEHLLV